jgi:DNA-binding beta-propeller fold protein YncE
MRLTPVWTRRAFLASAAALAAACRRRHAEGFRGVACVALAGDRAIALVDLLAFALRHTIPLSCRPSSLLAHPSPERPAVFAAGTTESGAALLERVDLAARKVVARVVVGQGAPVVRAAPRGFLWSSAGEPKLRAWHAEGLRPGPQLNLAARALDFDLSPVAPLVCVCLDGGFVQFADLASGKAFEPVRCGADASAVRFRRDGRVVMVACRGESLLRVFDTPSRRIMTELPLALRPDQLCSSIEGGQLFITGEGRDAVVTVYPYRTEIALTSLSGRKPGYMACSEDPRYLFVSNPSAGSLTVYDIDTQKVVAVTGVGVEPDVIVITPDQQYALVLNQGSGDIAVIRIASIRPGRARRASLFTMIPVGARPVAALVRSGAYV